MTDTTSPLADAIVTIFGGGGFIGRHVAQAVMQAGARVRVVQRRTDRAVGVKPLGNIGQVQIVGGDIRQPDHAARAAIGSDIVINCVGDQRDLEAVNVTGARHVAEAAAAAGARALVHISAHGAAADSESAYLRSKAAGEAEVLNAFPTASILRPTVAFGQQDRFINHIAGMITARKLVPVFAGATQMQPVFVGDVATAAANAARDQRDGVFTLGGPHVLTIQQIMDWVASELGETPLFTDVPNAIAGPLTRLTGWMPCAPMSHDMFNHLSQSRVLDARGPGLAALGITPTALAAVAPGWLERYRRNGRFTPAIRPGTA